MKVDGLGARAGVILNTIILVLFTFMCFYPFYYLLIYSFSNSAKAASGVYLLPADITLFNYKQILLQNDVLQSALISLSRTVTGTILTVICSSAFAYLLAQPQMPFRKFFYRVTVVTMYISVGLIPWFVVMKSYGLMNNFLLYIIPSAISVFYVILCKTYVEQLPPGLTEAAYLDGAGPVQIFIRVVFPLCKPVLATIAIFSAVNQWNSWTDNFYLVNTANLQTLQLTLLNYLTNQQMFEAVTNTAGMLANRSHLTTSPTTLRMAISLLVAAPILLVYPLFQRYFVGGIMIGAIKG